MATARHLLACLLAGGLPLVLAGCHAPWMDASDDSATSTPTVTNLPPRPRSTTVRRDPSPPAEERGASTAKQLPQPADEALLVGVMEKVRQVSELDPSATPLLLAELQETPPEFWSSAAEQFRASLAYHQQLAARTKQAERKETGGSGLGAGNIRPSSDPTADSPADPKSYAIAPENAVRLASFNEVAASTERPERTTTNHPHPQAPAPRPAPTADSPQPANWRESLTSAGDLLARDVASAPASTAEIHEHATLRMIRLLEGDTEAALAPIPGISPIEQDYWSRQLFALATYLDHHAQPDDKRRAAASAVHLDEALHSLREVGSLSLRNFTACKKVHAYGVYDPLERTNVSPGEPLTLYVELENYDSQPTEKGFVTLLGSSYELFDEAGTRVAGDSFPDVNDTCRSRRRDFHIQFGLALPAKLAPGRYRLQLVIRDRQSDKLGNASLGFEVAGPTKRESKRVESQDSTGKSQK
jgi:hypothetical protein